MIKLQSMNLFSKFPLLGHKVNTEDADLRKLIQCQVLNEASETLQKTLQEEVKKIQVKQSKSHTEFKKAITEGQDTLEGMYSRCLADAFKSEVCYSIQSYT